MTSSAVDFLSEVRINEPNKITEVLLMNFDNNNKKSWSMIKGSDSIKHSL
jgi:hypothetical protein